MKASLVLIASVRPGPIGQGRSLPSRDQAWRWRACGR